MKRDFIMRLIRKISLFLTITVNARRKEGKQWKPFLNVNQTPVWVIYQILTCKTDKMNAVLLANINGKVNSYIKYVRMTTNKWLLLAPNCHFILTSNTECEGSFF